MAEQKMMVVSRVGSNGFILHVTSDKGAEEVLIQDDGSLAFRSLTDAFDRAKEAKPEPSGEAGGEASCGSQPFSNKSVEDETFSESASELLKDPDIQQKVGQLLNFFSGATSFMDKGRNGRGGSG